jgi:hypothetical protein
MIYATEIDRTFPFGRIVCMLGAALLLAAAFAASALASEQVPQFDARPGCRAGADSGIVTKPDIDGCVRSELAARDQIAQQWSGFARADRTRCVDKTFMGGPPSYIEVLTCLEIARDVRKLPKQETDGNTGLATGLRR